MDADLDRLVLLDNTVLTNLALVGRADLVMRLWPERAHTTPSVLKEYMAGTAAGILPADAWAKLPVVTLTDQEHIFAARLSAGLGAGERTCLAVAVCRHGLFVSDDVDARRTARRYEVPTTGTIGILIRCVQRGYLVRGQANDLLVEMIAWGYRSPVTDLNALLD